MSQDWRRYCHRSHSQVTCSWKLRWYTFSIVMEEYGGFPEPANDWDPNVPTLSTPAKWVLTNWLLLLRFYDSPSSLLGCTISLHLLKALRHDTDDTQTIGFLTCFSSSLLWAEMKFLTTIYLLLVKELGWWTKAQIMTSHISHKDWYLLTPMLTI